MGSSRFPAALAILLLVPGQARGQQENPVLVYCDDGDIGVGEGSCAALTRAIQDELTDFYLTVVHVGELVELPAADEHVSAAVAERTRASAAIFSVWFTRSGFAPGNLITLHIYDPGIDQTISRTVPAFDNLGNLNHSDVAFHARIVMGASLYSDIDAIQNQQNLVALAIPEERVELIETLKPERRAWVRIDLGYLFMGYPTQNNWYHGMILDAAFLPIPRLEVFLDFALAFLQEPVTNEDPVWSQLENRHVLVGAGARYDVIGHHRIGLLPGAGLRVGISSSDVTVSSTGSSGEPIAMDLHYRSVHPSIWAGLDVRIHLVRRVSLGVGLRFENLFRRERVHLIPEDPTEKVIIFELSQFRFGAVAMVCISI